MEKATDSAGKLLNERVQEAADSAVKKMEEGTGVLIKETRKAKEEIEKVKEEMRYELGIRKFMFWATLILLFAQSIAMALLLLR